MLVTGGFDLKKKKLLAEPVFIMNSKELAAFAGQLDLPLPEKRKKDGTVCLVTAE